VAEVDTVTCHSFVNLTVITALKSVDFDEVTDKNKLAPFYGPRCRHLKGVAVNLASADVS